MENFVAIVGTNSVASTNRQLLQFMQRHFADQAKIELIEIADLPMFDKPADKKLPPLVQTIDAKIMASDGVIISTPEYDHSVPASLSNALAWFSYGEHPFVDKPVMITGASYGSLGSSRAQSHLRQILDAPELRARIMPSSEFLLGHSLTAFDEQGNLKDQQQVAKLAGLFADFLDFVKLTNQLVHTKKINQQEVQNFSWDKI
ncbi:NADPH-dependent FMN reductase [Lapidilactobacillus wuchangensis]|uniref:NADPH-dependent FMN reductase n=1 Tax=Lapidilactobacillus wuchangensis TaxID=2486001 RepID=UPI000F78EB43|nr:NADPH-dependent FMN reductase [Lapidilactobacillus wuchangensis]